MIAPLVAHDPVLDRITRTIVEHFHPVRIALFGSRARGDAYDDSDYDIMVVAERPDDDLGSQIYEAIRDIKASVDIVVRDAARFEEDRDDVGTLVYAVEHEGRILYGPPLAPKRVRERPRGAPRSLRAWLRRADNDFRNMEHALTIAEIPWDTICFHAHQCTEKLLKGVLIAGHMPPPRHHELPELLSLCPPELRENEELRSACAYLYKLWPRSRYPEAEEPTEAEGAEAVARALSAREILLRAIEQRQAD
jgi:HEPN domain-containing protein/predicted nucleotidyltransferase